MGRSGTLEVFANIVTTGNSDEHAFLKAQTVKTASIIYYCQAPFFCYQLVVNKFWKPWLLVALGGCFFLSPLAVSAQNSCRVQAVFVRPGFVRASFDRVNVVRSTVERPSLERASLEKPDVLRPTFERPSFIRPVFDDPCLKQGGSSGSSARSSYAALLDGTSEGDSKVAQNVNSKFEFPRHGVVLAARSKSSDTAPVGGCCGQAPVSRDQQYRIYR